MMEFVPSFFRCGVDFFSRLTESPRKEASMYATIRRYKIAPGSVEKLTKEIQQGFVPIVSKLSGFKEYFWVKTPHNEMFSVSVFENQAGAEESVRKASDYVREHNLASLLPNPPEVITGEVVVHQAQVGKSTGA